jgi:hypothetical protein
MRKGGVMIRQAAYGVLASALCLIVLPAAAHHNGGTYFDLSAEVEQQNVTVVSYHVVNPHGRLVYLVKDEQGDEIEWTAELPSANNVRRSGLGGELFKPGDKLLSIAGSPSRSGSNFIRMTRAVFANGDVAQITGAAAGLIRAEAK